MRIARLRLVLGIVGWLAVAAGDAWAAELLHADGRREPAEGLAQGKDGRWTVKKEGRTVMVPVGDVVVLVGDDGAETDVTPEVTDGAPTAAAAEALARLRDPKCATWFEDAAIVGASRTRGTLDALVEMAKDPDKERRRRAVQALVRMQTRESTVAAATAAVEEAEVGVRREHAYALFAVQEILRRCDAREKVLAALADKDRDARVTFALLAAAKGADAALEVLRREGLKHPDHHVRESSATTLGKCGDAAGEAVLISMLQRKRLPGTDAGDEESMRPHLVREQVETCGILAALRTEKGRAALRAAAKSGLPEVREAAEKALAAWVE